MLYVLPASRRRAADSGWTGGARLHTRPPSTVLGYRPHWPDCPAADRFKSTKPAAEAATR